MSFRHSSSNTPLRLLKLKCSPSHLLVAPGRSGRCGADVFARSTVCFWDLFSDRMASREEKASLKTGWRMLYVVFCCMFTKERQTFWSACGNGLQGQEDMFLMDCHVKLSCLRSPAGLWHRRCQLGSNQLIPIRDFHRISRCWDVEDLAWAASDFFEAGRRSCGKKMLRSQTLGFLASNPFSEFGSRIFSPHSDWAHQTWHQLKLTGIHWVEKTRSFFCPKWASSQDFCPESHHFSTFFRFFCRFFAVFGCFLRSFGARRGDSWNRSRGGSGGIFTAAIRGNVPALRHFLRADPESVTEESSSGRGLKNCWFFLLLPGVLRLMVPEEIQHFQVWC